MVLGAAWPKGSTQKSLPQDCCPGYDKVQQLSRRCPARVCISLRLGLQADGPGLAWQGGPRKLLSPKPCHPRGATLGPGWEFAFPAAGQGEKHKGPGSLLGDIPEGQITSRPIQGGESGHSTGPAAEDAGNPRVLGGHTGSSKSGVWLL